MKPFMCRIYNFNYSLEKVEKSVWKNVQKPPLARCVVRGWTGSHAAAKAYVAECGLFRASILLPLGCPISVIQFETSARRVWSAMKRRITWAGSCFFFDNGTEIYYITTCSLLDHLITRRNLQAIAYSQN